MYQLLLATLIVVPALASRGGIPVFARQASSSCSRDNLYRCFTASSAQAAPYCASAVAADTVTASTTITPTATATATATIFVTDTEQTTATVLSTTTITQTGTVTVTSVSTTYQTTITTTAFYATPLLNRRQAGGPACLSRDGSKSTSYPVSRITSACKCLYPKSTTTTPIGAATTVTTTATVMPTTTLILTSTVTNPVTEIASTETITTTISTTATISATAVVTSTVTYTKIGEGSGCVYNRYYRYENIPVSQSPDGRYQGSVDTCTKLCTDDPRCRQFILNIDYDKFNPGSYLAFCVIDDQPFQSGYLQCGVSFVAYYRDYQKNT